MRNTAGRGSCEAGLPPVSAMHSHCHRMRGLLGTLCRRYVLRAAELGAYITCVPLDGGRSVARDRQM